MRTAQEFCMLLVAMACSLWIVPGAGAQAMAPWHLGGYGASESRAPAAVASTPPAPGPHPVVVAVVDSGIIPGHPSLEGNLLAGYDMQSPPNNLRGRRSAVTMPDERSASCGGRSVSGSFRTHGTEVASVIAGNGVQGALGMHPQARIVPVRVMGVCSTTTADLHDALAWAAGLPVPGVPDNPHPARVINLSVAGRDPVCSEALRQLLTRLIERGVFVVAAAGNNFGQPLAAPANCPGVIAVGALSADNQVENYSALDPRIMMYAPGGGRRLSGQEHWRVNRLRVASFELDIWGREQPTVQLRGVGTSFAAPVVSGFIALWLSHDPDLTPARLQGGLGPFLREVTVPVHACSDCRFSGLANLERLYRP